MEKTEVFDLALQYIILLDSTSLSKNLQFYLSVEQKVFSAQGTEKLLLNSQVSEGFV